MPASACTLFCFLELSGIVWPWKSQTRSYLFKIFISIKQSYGVYCGQWEDPFSWFEGGFSNGCSSCVEDNPPGCFGFLNIGGCCWIWQQTWSSLVGFLRVTGAHLRVQLCCTISVMLCALFSDCKTCQSIEGFFSSVSPKNLPYGFTGGITLLLSNAYTNTLLQRADEGMKMLNILKVLGIQTSVLGSTCLLRDCFAVIYKFLT